MDASDQEMQQYGTSGKLSFVPRGEASWNAYQANGPSYLMYRVQRLGIDLSAMDGAVLGFRGGRMGIQRDGVGLSRYLATVHYLYDWEIRAETLRTLLTAPVAGAPMPAGGAPTVIGQDQSYWRFLAALRRSSGARQAVWLFGAPYQVYRLCALMQAVDAPSLRPGSVVTLGGGWKAFEGERVDRSTLGALGRPSRVDPRPDVDRSGRSRHRHARARRRADSPDS